MIKRFKLILKESRVVFLYSILLAARKFKIFAELNIKLFDLYLSVLNWGSIILEDRKDGSNSLYNEEGVPVHNIFEAIHADV